MANHAYLFQVEARLREYLDVARGLRIALRQEGEEVYPENRELWGKVLTNAIEVSDEMSKLIREFGLRCGGGHT